MKRYGIEFEMVVYIKSEDTEKDRDWLEKVFNDYEFDIDDDGSLRVEQDISSKYDDVYTYEMKSIPMTMDNCKNRLKELFETLLHDKIHRVKINEDSPNIRIDFNFSTGTHIHYSNIMTNKYDNEEDMDYDETLELTYFKNPVIIKDIVNYMIENCKYPTISKDMIRNTYSKANYNPFDRYSALNTSNENKHGTIEFRMCNLHGVKTREVLPALNNQITLINKAVAKGWKIAIIEHKKKMKKEYKQLKELTKVKQWKKKPVKSVSETSPNVPTSA